MAHHLEVLHPRVARHLGRVEGGRHRHAGDRELVDTAVGRGRLRTDQFVDRRDDVGHVLELVAQSAAIGDTVRPVDDQRHVDATLVGVLLVPLERGVAGLRPTPRIVGVAVGAADVVETRDRLVGRLDQQVEVLHLVQYAERSTLLARAVVREEQEQRVVHLSEGLEGGHQPTDLVVGVLEERGEGLL